MLNRKWMSKNPPGVVSEGIVNPSAGKIRPGVYLYRFASTTRPDRYYSGAWWFDFETLRLMEQFGKEINLGLSYCARAYLAVAYEWGSKCNVLVRALVKEELGAWGGAGRVQRDRGAPGGARILQPPPVVKQLYIPGLHETDGQQRPVWKAAFQPGAERYIRHEVF